jgi:hypothetical protein
VLLDAASRGTAMTFSGRAKASSIPHDKPPRLVLVNGLRPETSVDLYEDVAARLRARHLDVTLLHGLDHSPDLVRPSDVLVSNIALPPAYRRGARVHAGRAMHRPTSLRLLEDAGVPTMTWSLAPTRRALRRLFDTWGDERVLLKASFSYGGRGVSVLSRGAAWHLRWNRELDVFCREVDPDDGDVYKVELFNGEVVISWMSKAPPIRTLFRRGILRGLRGAYGERSLFELPDEAAHRLRALSRGLTSQGLGYVSVDLMRRPDGELVAIELNPRDVATWWTRQFPHMRERYAQALYELVLETAAEGETEAPG